MDMRDMLAGVRTYGYQHTDGRYQPAQQHLSTVRQALKELVPAGMRVLVSGSPARAHARLQRPPT
jgi:hypothetical protein